MSGAMAEEIATGSRTLIFLHVPKASGTTLHDILAFQYPEAGHFVMWDAKDVKAFRDLSPEAREKISILRGHLHYGVHEFIRKPCTYITLLRKPVDRMVSMYHYIRRTPTHYLYKDIRSATLEDFIEKRLTPEMDNYQTRQIAGAREENVPFGACDESLYAQAKKNLDGFAFVGLTERFDESILLLSLLLNWQSPPLYTQQNTMPRNHHGKGISQRIMDQIAQHNQFDMHLYEHAARTFELRVRNHDARLFRTALLWYRSLNRMHQQTLAARLRFLARKLKQQPLLMRMDAAGRAIRSALAPQGGRRGA